MAIILKKVNGRTYVYSSRSKRVPGKDNPVSTKEYIGELDPDTGRIHPKAIPMEEAENRLHEGEFRALEYGNVLIAKSAAESAGIVDALDGVFGEHSRTILALAVCAAVHPVPVGDPKEYGDFMDLSPILGDRRLTAKAVLEASRAIDRAAIRSYFKRMTVGKEPFYVYGMSGSTRNALATSGSMDVSRSTLICLSNGNGVPAGAFHLMGEGGNARVLRRAMESSALQSRMVFVVADWDDPSSIASLLMSNGDVVAAVDLSSPLLVTLMDGFGSRDAVRTRHLSRDYELITCRIGLVKGPGGWSWAEDGAKGQIFGLNLHLCRIENSDGGSSRTVRTMRETLERQLAYYGEDASKAHSVIDSAGLLNMDHSIFAILTTLDDWGQVARALDIRQSTISQSRILRYALFDDKSNRRYRGWEKFVMLLSVGIRTRVAETLREGGVRRNVDEAFMLAGSVRTVIEGSYRVRGRAGKGATEIMDLFVQDDVREK